MNDQQKIDSLLEEWKRQIQNNIKAHHHEGTFYKRRFNILGGTATGLGAVLAAVGIALSHSQIEWLSICVDISMGIVAALVGTVTFLGDDGKSAKHHEAANRYRALYLLISNILVIPFQSRGDSVKILDSIHRSFDDIVASSPTIDPKSIDFTFGKELETLVINYPEERAPSASLISDHVEIHSQLEANRRGIKKNSFFYDAFQYQLSRLKNSEEI